jgi:hypothetical protein
MIFFLFYLIYQSCAKQEIYTTLKNVFLMIKNWNDWLNESVDSTLKCYGFNLVSLGNLLKSPVMNEKILKALTETRDSGDGDISEDDIEDYKETITKDFKKVAASLGSTINKTYILNFHRDFSDDYFLPQSEDGVIHKRDKDIANFWFDIFSSVSRMFPNQKGPFSSRSTETSWLNSDLIKPNKNPQTHVVHAHFPWFEPDEHSIIATKETFEILEIVSAIGSERSTAYLKSLPVGTKPKKLRDELKSLITVNKYGL